MLKGIHEIQVRYNEIDAMGVAHNGVYFGWLDMARIRLLDQIGLPYKDLESQGVYLPVIETHIEYKGPCHFDEVIHIHTEIAPPKGLRLKADFKIFRADALIAVGYTVLAFINDQGLPCRPPQHLLKAFEDAKKRSTMQ